VQPPLDSFFPSPATANPTVTAPSPASSTPKTIVTIQDGETLGFSRKKPGLKDSDEEKVIIGKSVNETNETAVGLAFG